MRGDEDETIILHPRLGDKGHPLWEGGSSNLRAVPVSLTRATSKVSKTHERFRFNRHGRASEQHVLDLVGKDRPIDDGDRLLHHRTPLAAKPPPSRSVYKILVPRPLPLLHTVPPTPRQSSPSTDVVGRTWARVRASAQGSIVNEQAVICGQPRRQGPDRLRPVRLSAILCRWLVFPPQPLG